MGKKIVISFPGGQGSEIPLLYYGAKYFEDSGYEKIFIKYPMTEEDSLAAFIDANLMNALDVMKNINFSEYDHVVFVAKSIGTVVACKIKEMCKIPASLILFTPLEETLPYLNRENDILLVAAGEKDRYLSSEVLKHHCEQENINYYIEPGVGHRMEIRSDLKRNLDIIFHVIGRI